jgi:hypothetical protein
MKAEETREQVTVPYQGGNLTGDREHVERYIKMMEEQRALRARWPEDTREAMTALCQKFPTLRDADGVEPWDVDRFVDWLNGPAPGTGASLAGRFVLGVWNGETDWTEFGLAPPGKFDMYRAIANWDEQHMAAFVSWVIAPFWP